MENAISTRETSSLDQLDEAVSSANGIFGMPLCPLFYSSKSIKELTAALSKAQAEMSAAVRDAKGETGGGRKYNYSDLNAVMDVLREPLSRHGLAIMQPQSQAPKGYVRTVTVLSHSSGEWMASTTDMPVGKRVKGGEYVPAYDPHSYGSALTYARRYGLTSMVGVVPQGDDDDAGRAQQHHQQKTDVQQKKAPLPWTESDKEMARRIWAFLKTKTESEKDVPVYLENLCQLKGVRPVKNLRQLQSNELRQFFVKIKSDILISENANKTEEDQSKEEQQIDSWLVEMKRFEEKIIQMSSKENFLSVIGNAGYESLEQVDEKDRSEVKRLILGVMDNLLKTKK